MAPSTAEHYAPARMLDWEYRRSGIWTGRWSNDTHSVNTHTEGIYLWVMNGH